MRYIYIVRCIDSSLYTGITNDIDKRLYDHNNSKIGAKYTQSRRPVHLVWSTKVSDRKSALQLEYKIKRLPKLQKEKLIKIKTFSTGFNLLKV